MGSGRYIKKKKEMKFQSVEALQQVVNVVNEASDALSDKKRTIRESAIPEVLLGAIGAGAGGAISFTALYGLGTVGLSTVGLSAAGITSGLAAAGAGASAVMGGLLSPMVAGIFVLALPAAGLAAAGVGTAVHMKNRQLRQEKERLYQEVLKKHQAVILAQKQALNESRERQEYLQSLNTLLARAVQDLKHDLGYAS